MKVFAPVVWKFYAILGWVKNNAYSKYLYGITNFGKDFFRREQNLADLVGTCLGGLQK